MTLGQVQAVRDKYYNAIMDLDLIQLDHSIEGASYSHDTHRDSLQKAFEYWSSLYDRKASAGATARLDKKAV